MTSPRTTRSTTAARSRAKTTRDVPLDRQDEPDVDDAYDGEDLEPAAREQRAEATGRHITVDLCGEEIRVIPAGAWRVSSQRKLTRGDLDGFMQSVLHEDDYDLYVDLDPTADEFNDFVVAAQEASGGQGKSHGPRPSSRPTRKR